MCGIAGIYTPGHAIDSSILDQMAQRLAHRGPDGAGKFIDHDLGFVHTRLSIVDLAGGAQPLFSPSGRSVTVANGEIYNAPDIFRGLAARSIEPASHSDCAVIPILAEQDTAGFLPKLRGMFALAVFDRDRRTLVLARDRMGIKPLYVCRVPHGLAFASEIKGLWPLVSAQATMNPAAAMAFLQQNFVIGHETAIKGIERLMPGERIDLAADGRIRKSVWWSLTDEVRDAHETDWVQTDALTQFDELLHESMEEHRHADVPIGLFLSGGIDSSILAYQQAGSPDAHAWTVGFDTHSVHDERAAAQQLADQLNIPLSTILLEPERLFDRQVMALWAGDDLMGDAACLPTLELAQAASRSHKVVFSGEGGDEVFAGYGRYRPVPIQRWIRALLKPGSGGFRTRGRLDRSPGGLLMPELWRQDGVWRDAQAECWQQSRGLDLMTRMQLLDMQGWLVEDLLTKLDRMLMAYGVEGRVPFLDHRMVLFGLSLPVHLRRHGRLGKQLLRQWLARQSAASVNPAATARKKGFTVPVGDWVRSVGAHGLFEVLSRQAVIAEMFHLPALSQCVQQAVQGDRSSVDTVMGIVHLAIWYRIVFEQDFSRPPDRVDPIAWLRA
jgi:asparagine synthase (glutamine-hydrolysing)